MKTCFIRHVQALANVSIKPLESETTAGQGIFPTEVAADEVHASRVRRFGPKIPLAHVIEAHHRQYGGAWLKGRDQSLASASASSKRERERERESRKRDGERHIATPGVCFSTHAH